MRTGWRGAQATGGVLVGALRMVLAWGPCGRGVLLRRFSGSVLSQKPLHVPHLYEYIGFTSVMPLLLTGGSDVAPWWATP